MAIKLIIENELECDLYFDHYNPDTKETKKIRRVKHYDENKWNDGHTYEFNTLKEVINFIDTCDIDFTDEYGERFCEWDWEEIDIDYYIDSKEDNLIIMLIASHNEWRD